MRIILGIIVFFRGNNAPHRLFVEAPKHSSQREKHSLV